MISKLTKNKKSISLFIVLIMLMQMIQAFGFGGKIFADTVVDFSYITDISLTDISGTSYDLNTKEFGKNEALRIKYKFSIPTDKEIKSGEKFKITVPKEFIVKDAKIISIHATTSESNSGVEETSGAGASVITGDGLSTANWTGIDILTTTAPAVKTEVTSGQAANVDTSLLGNEVALAFNQPKEIGTKLSGEFYVDVTFNTSEIGNALSKSITFTQGGQPFKEFTLKFLFQFITGVYLNNNEFSGKLALNNENFEAEYKAYYENSLSKVEFNKDSQMYIGYRFVIPQGKAITAGQTLTLNIPNEFFKLSSAKSVDLWTDDKAYYIGTVTYTTDNKITITFAGLDSTHNEIEGNFWFGRQLNKGAIGNENPHPITFEIGNSESKTFNLNFKKEEIQSAITKTGTYSAEKQVIDWKIVVDPGNFDRSNVSVIDDLKALDVTKNTFKSGSLKINGSEADDSCLINNVLKYNWASVLAGQKQTIEFQTVPNETILNGQGVTTTITNTATLKMDGKVDQTTSAAVTIKNDYISKKGSYNSSTKSIVWTITVNASKVMFTNPVITDKIPEFLTFDSSNVKVNGAAAKPEDVTYDSTTREFKYNLPSDNETRTITFSTPIDQSKVQETFLATKSFENTATLNVTLGGSTKEFTSKYTVNAGVNGDVISKRALGYNKATKEITWEIVVNSIGIKIENPKVTETIGSDQEYVENSAICDGNSVVLVKEGSNKYSISLGTISETTTGAAVRTISEPHTITLKTRVKDHGVIYRNDVISCKNTAVLSGINIRNTQVDAYQSVDSKLIQKDGSYDYNTREATWTIKVNESQTPVKHVQIKDVINPGQQYVDGSLKIIKTAGTTDAAATMDVSSRLSYAPASYSDLGQGGILNYNFGDISDKYTITFKTKIAYDSAFSLNNGNIVIANKAEFKTSETTQEISSNKIVSVNNFMIKKDYSYTSGNDYITWNIKLNRNNADLNGMIITDTIPDGLQIDMDSVKLSEVKFDTSSNIIDGSKKDVDSGKYTTSYNFENKDFVLTYPYSTNKSYLLQFDTIAKTSGSSYSNKVTLKTNALTHTAQTTSSQVRFNVDAYGGSASTTTGTIAIKKVDSENTNQTLSGAKFELLRNGVVVQVSDATDPDGKAIFKRLKFNTEYTVREVEAPKGYKLSNWEDKFTIANHQFPSNVKTYTVTNQKIKKNIELVKKSTNGDFLEGADFVLYRKADDGSLNPISTETSNSEGKIVFKDVPYGNYVIKETKAPQGYNLSGAKVEIKDTDFKTEETSLNYTVTNEPFKKTIQLHKQSEDGLPLGGATFALYKEDDVNFSNILKGVTSNKDGLVSFEGLDYGNYVIKEVMAPQGYDISDKLIHIAENDFIKDDAAVISAGIIIDPKAKEIKKSLEFFKQSSDGTPLAGAIFGLYDENDSKFENMLMTTVSNSDGSVKFNNVKKDNYKIKEIQAPEGYKLTDTIIQVRASEFDVQEEVIKTNPNIFVNKRINATGKVTDKDGKDIIPDIKPKVIIETDGSETLLVETQKVILLKQPDGGASPLTDTSKVSFSSDKGTIIEILPDGNIRVKNLEKGTEEKVKITYEVGGQKIIIGTIDIKVSSDGDVTFVNQLIDPYGIVTDSTTGKVIDGVKVELYYSGEGSRNDPSKWNKRVDLPEIIGFAPNDNHNPQLTDKNGSYAFMVFPYTDYYIVATKEGYDNFTSRLISVNEEIVKFDIKMDKTKIPASGGSGVIIPPVNDNKPNQNSGGGLLNNGLVDNAEPEKPSSNISDGSSSEYERSSSDKDNSTNDKVDRLPSKEDSTHSKDNSLSNKENSTSTKGDSLSNKENIASNKDDSLYSKNDRVYDKDKNKLLPQAGSFVDFTVLISFGAILIILGVSYRIRRKSSKNKVL